MFTVKQHGFDALYKKWSVAGAIKQTIIIDHSTVFHVTIAFKLPTRRQQTNVLYIAAIGSDL